MAERKSGPVKPPVIDLKAREAEKPAEPQAAAASGETSPEVADKPAAAAGAETQRAAPPPPPRPPARLAMPWSAISIAAVGGALLGAGLVYGLGNWLPLPNQRPLIADPATRLDQQDASLSDVTARLTAIEEQGRRTQVSLDATIQQLDTGLAELRQSVEAIPTTAPVDLTPIEQQLAGLEDRVTAIGAGASSADATALAETISAIETELASLRAAVDSGGSDDTGAALDGLRSEVAALQSAIAAQATGAGGGAIGPAVRLPLVVSGLESAVTNGRPFAGELGSLRGLLPDLAVPSALEAVADTGLPRPDAVEQRFEAAVPAILAGRAAESSGDITTDALEWMKGLLALRPVGEVAGDSPEATVAQLEAAVARHDFTAAASLLAALPPAMQAGAGAVGGDIAALAAADGFLAEVRSRALGPALEANP